MKIAYIVDTFPQLSETFILNQLRGLLRAGYDVDIYTNRVNSAAMSDENVVDITDGCTIITHPAMPKNSISRVIKAVYLFVAGIRTEPLTLLKTLNIFKYGADAYTLRLLYMYLRFRGAPGYDVLHCSFGNYALLVNYLRQMDVVRGKIISSFRGQDISKFVKSHGVGIYRDLFRDGALFLPVCEYFKKLLIDYGCPEEKIKVHRSGIDLTKYPPVDKSYDLPVDQVRMVSVGRLVEKKGFMYSIKAVERYAWENPKGDIQYTIIGAGPLYSKIKRYILRKNLGGIIKLAGPMPHDRVLETIKNAHVLINCSVTASDGDIEGIPNVLKEAMAMGIPVISSSHSGIPDLVKDGHNGFLVPERDVNGIWGKLSFIIDNYHQMGAIVSRARVKVEKEYDSVVLNEELLQYYSELNEN